MNGIINNIISLAKKAIGYTAPTPASGTVSLYFNSDGKLVRKDDAGTTYIIEEQTQPKQTHTSGATVTVDFTKKELVVNPAAALAALTITMPLTANLYDGQEFRIGFGGTITNGYVINQLSIIGNTSQTVLNGTLITSAQAGDGFIIKWDSTTTCWHIY